MSDTIFDKILAGEIPSQKVFENEHVYAFRDINPAAPTHVLVIPKWKVARFAELKDQQVENIGEFFKHVSMIASQLGLESDGYRIVINNGEFGCQTVEYLHAHIIGGRQLGSMG